MLKDHGEDFGLVLPWHLLYLDFPDPRWHV